MTLPSPAAAPTPHAVDDLVVEHLPLARYAATAVANRLQLPAHVNRDDLIASAQVALVESAKRYDPTTGASFATYAHRRLQGAVLDELRATDWATRTVRAEGRRLSQATEALTAELGAAPTRDQIADRLGMRPGEIDALRDNIARANVSSIDEYRRDAAGEPGDAREIAGSAECPEGSLLHRERMGYLFTAIDHLPDRLGEVIERNFFSDQSLTEIALDMGLTLSAISQMRAKALRLLHAAITEIVDGQPVAPIGGVRARAQQRDFIQRVATVAPAAHPRLADIRNSA